MTYHFTTHQTPFREPEYKPSVYSDYLPIYNFAVVFPLLLLLAHHALWSKGGSSIEMNKYPFIYYELLWHFDSGAKLIK